MSHVPPQCMHCILLLTGSLTCPAYPKGIPDTILTNNVRHNKVLAGQTGTVVFIQDPAVEDFIMPAPEYLTVL